MNNYIKKKKYSKINIINIYNYIYKYSIQQLSSIFYYFIYKNNKSFNLLEKNEYSVYYIHKWENNNIKYNYNVNYYHNIIIPRGNNKFLFKNDLQKYSIIHKSEHFTLNYHHLMNKIQSNFMLSMTANILRNTFRKIFSDILVDVDKLIEIIYNTKNTDNLVICPNHRSYCDFLLISYILFELKYLGVKLPRIAATSDFKKIPFIGKLFELLGCFYVERGKGRVEELNNKIHNMIDNNENIEFFIEGTRSRTRQTLPFKTGLIKALQETNKNFQLLPVTLSYEKIPEQPIFMEEIISGEKSPMSISGLFHWATRKIFDNEKYGNIYVKFSDLIELKFKMIISKNAIYLKFSTYLFTYIFTIIFRFQFY
jgi:1-acyl-sn-glycerol-3-phosphate acyltransferase